MALHSRPIAATLIIDGAALMLYNVAGMRVTGHAGAVFRTVLETSRTLFVWLVDLALFYGGAGGGTLGESWSKWSFVQAAGFGVMVAGTLVYGAGDDADAAEPGSTSDKWFRGCCEYGCWCCCCCWCM